MPHNLFLELPVLVIAIVGWIYLIPRLTGYHQKILAALGEQGPKRLQEELVRLATLSTATGMVIAFIVLGAIPTMHPVDDGASRMWFTVGSLVFACFTFGVTAYHLRQLVPSAEYHVPIVIAKLLSGNGFVLLAVAAFMGMREIDHPVIRYIVPSVMVVYLAHLAWGTRELGRETGVRTPWPLPAALAVTTLIGIITL